VDTSVVTDSKRRPPRRMRTLDEKRAIVAETLAPGASVAEIARQHGVNANLLFGWRRQQQRGLLDAHTRVPRTKLLRVVQAGGARLARTEQDRIEIERADGLQVRIVGAVERDTLVAVLEALSLR
jgi:transposase